MSEQAPHNVSMGRRGRARRERRLALVVGALVLALGAAGCGASRAFTRAENAARAGDWDAAVEYWKTLVTDEDVHAEGYAALAPNLFWRS